MTAITQKIIDLCQQRWPLAGQRDIQAIAGDGGARQYFRIEQPGVDPTTVIAAFVPQAAEEIGSTTTVARFGEIQQILQASGANVPEIYMFSASDGIYLQEDLGTLSLADAIMASTKPGRLELYREAWAQATIGHQGLQTARSNNTIQFTRFSQDHLWSEYMHFIEEIVDRHENVPNNIREKLLDVGRQLVNSASGGEYGASLRDFQARNVMVQSQGTIDKCVLIDFQDAFWAPLGYDIICMTRDSSLPLTWQDSLFLEREFAYNSGIDQQQFDIVGALRSLKDAGRFAYFERHGKSGYAQWIPRTLAKAMYALQQIEGVDTTQLCATLTEFTTFTPAQPVENLLS